MRKYIAVENVLNIFDINRHWLFIPQPGFNGYEISNDGYVRSMKHFKKYPYGIIIKPVQSESNDPVFELSDDNNKRKRIKHSEIMNLALNNTSQSLSYPRATVVTDISSRNKYVKNDSGAYVKVYNGPSARRKIDMPDIDSKTSFPKFTIIREKGDT